MTTRILYAVDTSTGERLRLMTLHPDGSLTAEASYIAEAVPVYRDKHGFSDEFIFEYTKRRGNGYVRYVEETVED
ncbi:hypothetical protein AB0J55_16600 [Amycolatopsis sp. NPDC049688]|uniref:hypothetical protein n=1 Tax=Amycolatopsis sp. NPDC049688 TaxID=3154733 RepID=UPI0034442269